MATSIKRPTLKILDNSIIHFWSLLVFWLFSTIFFLYHFGIVTNYEATKYIEQANNLQNGSSYDSNNFIFYSTEILLIALFQKVHLGYEAVVFVQLSVNLFSNFAFYKLIQRLTQKNTIAFVATVLLLGMFYYQSYNVYLFTESLYFSFSIFFAYWLFRINKLLISIILCTILFLALLCFTRPTGVLFLPPTLLYFLFNMKRKQAIGLLLISTTLGLAGFYFLLNSILNSGGELNFLLPYIEEHVICGVPTVHQASSITLPVNQNSVPGLWYLITTNWSLFLRLAAKRFVAFWGVYRSYYSPMHNVFIMSYFFSLYLLIIVGFKKMFSYQLSATIFLLTYIFLIMLTVLLSCDEWHNRFIFSILPFLLILASGAFLKLSKAKQS